MNKLQEIEVSAPATSPAAATRAGAAWRKLETVPKAASSPG